MAHAGQDVRVVQLQDGLPLHPEGRPSRIKVGARRRSASRCSRASRTASTSPAPRWRSAPSFRRFPRGIDKAKIYLDSSLSDEQRRELDAIFHGERGGLWAGLRGMIGTWLPSMVTSIEIHDGEAPRVHRRRRWTDHPSAAQDRGRPASDAQQRADRGRFGQDVLELATATCEFSDPDLRVWESLGYGATSTMEWKRLKPSRRRARHSPRSGASLSSSTGPRLTMAITTVLCPRKTHGSGWAGPCRALLPAPRRCSW